LWQQLGAIAPQRGLPGVVALKCEGPLVLAPFPPVEGYPNLDNDAIVTTFAELQDATRGVRDLRAKCDVSPKERVTVTVVVPDDHAAAFKAQSHVVRHMAGIAKLHVSSDAKRPANAGSITIGDLRIYVHDISDDAAERERATKSLADLERQIKGKESKLGNEKFVANAKPEVVQAERERLKALVTQRIALEAQLVELGA